METNPWSTITDDCRHNQWYICLHNKERKPMKFLIVDGTFDGLGVFPMWEDMKGNVYDPEKDEIVWLNDLLMKR